MAGKRPTSTAGSIVGVVVVLIVVIALVAGHGGGSSPGPVSGIGFATLSPSASDLSTTVATAAPTPTDAPTVAPVAAAPSDACHAGGVAYCVLNPDVSQATIHQTICVSGWTATVRPPESYTYDLKRQQMAQEGLPGTTSDYEEDHRMPLELGGAPSDAGNLSPESPPSPNPKDSDESSLRRAVCNGGMTLAAAQAQLVATWLAAYPGYRR